MKHIIYLCIASIVLSACNKQIEIESQNTETPNLVQFVNPFVGTKKMGHTYPGATAPFGMVQLSPETRLMNMYVDGKYN
ncbi:MAG: hypothetical protein HN691_08475, partial [Bacteroidetes bacterium]|nr:hypothetical protein [Bacteroidota bacterium]